MGSWLQKGRVEDQVRQPLKTFVYYPTTTVEAMISLVAILEAKQQKILEREDATPEEVLRDVKQLLTKARVMAEVIFPILAKRGPDQHCELSQNSSALDFCTAMDRLRSRAKSLCFCLELNCILFENRLSYTET
jgi:hypothetical protein